MIEMIFRDFAGKFPECEIRKNKYGYEISCRHRFIRGYDRKLAIVTVDAYNEIFLCSENFDLSSPDSLEKIDKFLIRYLLGIGQ